MVFLHILGAFALVAGNAAGLGATSTARRSSSPQAILHLMRIHRRAAAFLIGPGVVLVLATGIYLTNTAEISFGEPWIAASLILLGLAVVLGVAVLVPEQVKAIREAEELVAHDADDVSQELRRHVASARVVGGEWTQQLLLVVWLYLMVFRP